MSFFTVRLTDRAVELLDQRRLPSEEVYLEATSVEEVARAIEDMVVRGAPAIGVTAAMGVALGLRGAQSDADLGARLPEICARLAATRPTAVNLRWALDRMQRELAPAIAEGQPPAEIRSRADALARAMAEEDVASCRAIGDAGAARIPEDARVLTHCNAGALATAGYGTALGVIRSAASKGRIGLVLACETRPFLQGARLTAWELHRDDIPVQLITDSMAGALMAQRAIDCIVVGADRIARNGDVANKIGTYALAVLADAHDIPFYVAAPLSTFDPGAATGAEIPIEERDPREVLELGSQRIAPAGVSARHPAFDVTPARLVRALITDHGVLEPPFGPALARASSEGTRV